MRFGRLSFTVVSSAYLLLAAFSTETRAAHSWSNPAGGLYSTPGNWIGGVPLPGQTVAYSINGTYTVNVDVTASHSATQFASTSADVTLNITAPSYTITGLTQIGALGTNSVTVGGGTLNTQNVEIAPFNGTANLTVNGPMQSEIISVGGRVSTMTGPPWPLQNPGGSGTLTLNAGANVTATALLAESSGGISQIIFNGGTMTIAGHARPDSRLDRIGDGTSVAVLNLQDGPGGGHHSFGAGTLTIANNAVVNYNSPNGELSVGNIVTESGSTPGVFNWIAGYVGLYSPLEVGTNSFVGSNLELTSARRLSAPEVVVTNGSTLALSGGELYLDAITVDSGGSMDYDNGYFFLNTGDLEIGPNGITNSDLSLTESNDFIAVESGNLLVATGRSLELNGGGLRAKSLMNNGLFTFQSGYFELLDEEISIGPTGDINNSPNISIGGNSQIRTYYNEVEIQSGQTVSIDGGSLVAGYLTNNGTLLFNSGTIALSQSDLTIGPTGQFRHQPVITLDNNSSIQMTGRAMTIEAGQTVNLQNGFIYTGPIQVDGSFHVNDTVSATIVTTGPTGNVTIGSNGDLHAQKFVRRNLVVGSGSVLVTELSTPTDGMENYSFTMNGGHVYADTLKIGAATGYVDTLTMNGGTLSTAHLQATGGASSVIIFDAGEFTSFNSEVDGPGTFVVGNGTSFARFSVGGSGAHTFADGIAISQNAVLRGGTTINGDVANAGLIEPGNAFGDLTINGDLTNTGVLEFEFSNAPGFADKIIVSGTLDAGGIFKVVGYGLNIGESYDLVDFTTLVSSGYTFDFTEAEPLPGSHWDASEFASTGRIHLVADNGDFNQDGVVDAADYIAWRKGSGAPPSQVNHDLWRSHFGETSSEPGQGGSVPEPAAIAMLLTVALSAMCRCRAWAR